MAVLGYECDWEQCCQQVKDLQHGYREVKNYQWHARRRWQMWQSFEELDLILRQWHDAGRGHTEEILMVFIQVWIQVPKALQPSMFHPRFGPQAQLRSQILRARQNLSVATLMLSRQSMGRGDLRLPEHLGT